MTDVIYSGAPDFEKFWQSLFEASEFAYPLYQTKNIEFYKEYLQPSHSEDLSFVIVENQVPLAGMKIILHVLEHQRELSCYGLPAVYAENDELEAIELDKAHKKIRTEIDQLIEKHSVQSILFRDWLPKGRVSVVGKHLLDKGTKAEPYFTQIISLNKVENELYRKVRKSYKSLINWGKKNLQLHYLEPQTVTPKEMEQFHQLHVHVTGRETRSEHTWDIQYEMIRQNEAFGILGELDGELVTAALFPLSSKLCMYGVSASKRELFEKPLSHAVLWKAILYAQEKGCEFFEMGTQLYLNQNPSTSTKELNISTFKRGFGGETRVWLNMNWKAE